MPTYCKVKRTMLAQQLDSWDADTMPDSSPLHGNVTFTPQLADGDAVTLYDDGKPVTIVPAPIAARISDGQIFHRGVDYIELLAGGDRMNPATLVWKATFTNLQAKGTLVKLRPVVFEAVPDGTVDLTIVAPAPGTAGQGVVKGRDGDHIEGLVVEGTNLVLRVKDGDGVTRSEQIAIGEVAKTVANDAVTRAEAARAGAEAAKADAVANKNAAAGSATNAKTSETNAKTSETKAAGSATTATSKAGEASTSASAAKASETNAKASETNAASSASTASQASMVAQDAAVVATAAAQSVTTYSGTGSPEGKVTAGVGALYVDSVATCGAVTWRKMSGTDTTGWRVENGDTGWRDVSYLLTNASGKLLMSRSGSRVSFYIEGVIPSSALSSGSTFVSAMPSGFRPIARRDFAIPQLLAGSGTRSAYQFPAGSIGVWSPSTSDKYYLERSWTTSDTWPASLPGTPA